MRWIVIGLVLTLVPVSAQAAGQFLRANELVEMCEGEERAANRDCYSYLMGVQDAAISLVNGLKLEPIFCTPKVISLDELRLKILKHLADKSGLDDASASSMVLSGMQEAYLCE